MLHYLLLSLKLGLMKLPPNSIVVSGPVIIEDDKVLLNKERKAEGITPWLFPGGEVEDFDKTLEAACMRECKEEMGIDIEVHHPLRTIMYHKDGRVIILVHFLARRLTDEIKPDSNIVNWHWYDIHNLPDDCAPNVYEIIDDYNKHV